MEIRNTRRGFTLIELLVVVIIIAVLAAIALPQYQKAVMKARAAEIQTFISYVEKGMDLYVLENGYPSINTDARMAWDDLNIDVTGYCTNTPTAPYYKCPLMKDIFAYLHIDSTRILLEIGGWESSPFGPFSINVGHRKDGTIYKLFSIDGGTLKSKPLADYLQQNDPNWEISLPSGM